MITQRLLSTFIIATASVAALAASAQTQPIGTVLFSGGAQPMYRLRQPTAVVWDESGKPLFKGDEAFIRQYAANSTGRVFEWDPAKMLIRVSAKRPIWLSCDAVEEMAIACSTLQIVSAANGGITVSIAGNGGVRGGGVTPPPPGEVLRGVPNCPGDVRCPKILRDPRKN